MSPYAQTIVQLHAQAERAGIDVAGRRRLARVHDLALSLFTGRHRGSGRPFLDHLVGTASVLLAHGANLDVVAAGLLHAAYEQGDFGHGDSGVSWRDRREVASVDGAATDATILAYVQRPWNDAAAQAALASSASALDRDVLMMRLANELDDHLDLGILYCADAPRRLTRLERLAGPAVALARHLGAPALADELAEAFDACRHAEVPAALRSTHGSSYIAVPRSCSLRLFARLRRARSPD